MSSPLGPSDEISPLARASNFFQKGPELGKMSRIHSLVCKPCGRRLQQQLHVVCILNVLRREFYYEATAVLVFGDQSTVFKILERFAQGCLRHAEPMGDILFIYPFARL
jgi:hypothetical protein